MILGFFLVWYGNHWLRCRRNKSPEKDDKTYTRLGIPVGWCLSKNLYKHFTTWSQSSSASLIFIKTKWVGRWFFWWVGNQLGKWWWHYGFYNISAPSQCTFAKTSLWLKRRLLKRGNFYCRLNLDCSNKKAFFNKWSLLNI